MKVPSVPELIPTSRVAQSDKKGRVNADVSPRTKFVTSSP
jgi:hypothetical protein